MRRLILVLMGVMLLAAPMVYAEEIQGNFTRVEAINALNTWSVEQLDVLPGVGPSLAANIIDTRPFTVIEDLGAVSGISVPGVTYDNIRVYFWGADMIPNDEDGDPEPAGDIDKTGSVSVSAVIAGVTSLSVTDQSGDGALPFGTITEQYQKAPEYISIDAVSNYGSWAIEIYTDNFPETTPDTEIWGYAYGGLVDIANVQKIPLGWAAFDVETPAESTGNPAELNRWSYVKDKSDVDDPSTAGNDESWAARGGYANIAFGGPGYAKVINPYVEGGDDLTAMPFYVYLETADTAAPGTYSGTLYFDLYHE